jgi:hypothetical protein
VDTELQVLAKRLVELGEVVLVFSDLAEDVHALLDDVLANDLENLVLLEGLAGNVKREILRVDDTLDEVEVLGNEVLAVVHDEDTANVSSGQILGGNRLAESRIKRNLPGDIAQQVVVRVQEPAWRCFQPSHDQKCRS